MIANADQPASDCRCSVVSDYCNGGPLGGLFEIKCKNAWCKFSEKGCGRLGRYACEGLCFIQTS